LKANYIEPKETNMFYEIDICEDAMVLLDSDGNSYECQPLTTYRNAKRTLGQWINHYAFDVASAYKLLASHFLSK
jgi:hypothetical protein